MTAVSISIAGNDALLFNKYILCKSIDMFTLWNSVVMQWKLEAGVPCMHVLCPERGVWIFWSTELCGYMSQSATAQKSILLTTL